MTKKQRFNNKFMLMAIRLSRKMMQKGKGGPFAAIVVKNGKIVARGYNKVTSGNDPTAHAEIVVIRRACRKLRSFRLTGCKLYTSCGPCPMCLAAIYWAKIKEVYYANRCKDAAQIGFADCEIYQEIKKPVNRRTLIFEQIMREEALVVFKEWKGKSDKICY